MVNIMIFLIHFKVSLESKDAPVGCPSETLQSIPPWQKSCNWNPPSGWKNPIISNAKRVEKFRRLWHRCPQNPMFPCFIAVLYLIGLIFGLINSKINKKNSIQIHFERLNVNFPYTKRLTLYDRVEVWHFKGPQTKISRFKMASDTFLLYL